MLKEGTEERKIKKGVSVVFLNRVVVFKVINSRASVT
jgi:hypothetical protein